MVGTAVNPGDVAVSVSGGSTVNLNSSTAGEHQNPKNLGGGGIAVVSQGGVVIDGGQVSGNQTVGMYSGGIVVGIGNVRVLDGSQIDFNSNNGPGGGIAANFGGRVTVSGGSQVNHNTGAAIGGGVVNFSGPLGVVSIDGGSQVSFNTLTNGETIGRVIAVFPAVIFRNTSFHDFAVAVGGDGGAAMLRGLDQADQAAQQAAGPLRGAVRRLSDPLGVLVAGGGISTLLAPIKVRGGSRVDGNYSGMPVPGSHGRLIGLAGGIFALLGRVTIDQSHVDGNQAPNGDGGGIWSGFGRLDVTGGSTITGNSSGGDGGGIWNGGLLSMSDSTVSFNESGGDGGGLFNSSDGNATVQSSLFQGNEAQSGGGIFSEGELSLGDVVFIDNSPDDIAGH